VVVKRLSPTLQEGLTKHKICPGQRDEFAGQQDEISGKQTIGGYLMGREIITTSEGGDTRFRGTIGAGLASAEDGTTARTPDEYGNRLLKYIPAEVVAVYLTLQGILQTTEVPPQYLGWTVFIILLVLTPVYLYRLMKVRNKMQLFISTVSFAVWVFTLGGPFATVSWYHPLYGALLLPLYTFAVALYEPAPAVVTAGQ
jgi:hypothetical protein